MVKLSSERLGTIKQTTGFMLDDAPSNDSLFRTYKATKATLDGHQECAYLKCRILISSSKRIEPMTLAELEMQIRNRIILEYLENGFIFSSEKRNTIQDGDRIIPCIY